jgi:hypothetical protein
MNEIHHMDSHGLNNMDETDNIDDLKDIWDWNTWWNFCNMDEIADSRSDKNYIRKTRSYEWH